FSHNPAEEPAECRKTKKRPSGVHAPQHCPSSQRALRSSGCGRNRCRFEPSAPTSQMVIPPVSGLVRLNRIRLPSGDQSSIAPPSSASFRTCEPSASAIYRAPGKVGVDPANTISLPSGDQAAETAKISPTRLGDPASSGSIHNARGSVYPSKEEINKLR